MNTIGNNIKKIRELRNFSEEYMADELGISQSAYSNRETGKVKNDTEMLKRIARILKVTVEFITHFHVKNLFDEE